MLTKQQIAKYVADPSQCPYCEGTDIVGDSIEPVDNVHANRTVNCENCALSWTELMTVTGLEEVFDGI